MIYLRKRLGNFGTDPQTLSSNPIHATADGVRRALSTNTDPSVFGLLFMTLVLVCVPTSAVFHVERPRAPPTALLLPHF
jgi:hypothetical protein